MFRTFSKALTLQTLIKTDTKFDLRSLSIIKQASVGADFYFYVIGGSSLVIICLTILYLVYRKRQMSNLYGGDPALVNGLNKDDNTNIEKENKENDANKINGDKLNPKANIDEDDEIKVQDKTNDVPQELNDLSVDRSKSNLIRQSSITNEANSIPNKNLENPDKVNEKEEDKEENERSFSESSQVSKLSAHKIVVRNCQKDLVCYTNEHRSEPDVEILNDDFLKNNEIQENNEEMLSAEDIDSYSEEDESSNEDEKPKKKTENKGPVNVSDIISEDKKTIDINPISKKLSIKEKRRISDFDEETKDQVNKFAVFKQGDIKKELNTQISKSPTKKSSTNQFNENNQVSKQGVLKNKNQSTNIISRNSTKKGK